MQYTTKFIFEDNVIMETEGSNDCRANEITIDGISYFKVDIIDVIKENSSIRKIILERKTVMLND